MLDYLVPALFALAGLAIRLRIARLRACATPVPPMLQITGSFALAVGGFLLALTIMCRP